MIRSLFERQNWVWGVEFPGTSEDIWKCMKSVSWFHLNNCKNNLNVVGKNNSPTSIWTADFVISDRCMFLTLVKFPGVHCECEVPFRWSFTMLAIMNLVVELIAHTYRVLLPESVWAQMHWSQVVKSCPFITKHTHKRKKEHSPPIL